MFIKFMRGGKASMSDNLQQTGIYAELAKFYRSLLPKPNTTVTFFDRGDFYSILGQDAAFVSKEILHRTSSEIKQSHSSREPLEYINVNKVQFEVVIRDLLLVNLYRVEVYDCKTWNITYKGSPGNISQFEDIIYSGSGVSSESANHSFCVAALYITNKDSVLMVSLATADQTSREFVISEFPDNDRFSNLEAILIQLSPKECLVPSGETTPQVVRDILSRTNCLVSDKRKGDFANKDVSQDLTRLLKQQTGVSADALPELRKEKAVSCLGVLIKYLEFMTDQANFGKFRISTFDLSLFMKLDAAAVRALNLMPNALDRKEESLLGILDVCKTSQGHRLLRQFIKQPLVDINKINERLDLVEIFYSDSMIRQSVHEEHLPTLPDFQKLAKRLATNKANLQDCYRIYQALSKLPSLDRTLDDYSGEHKQLLRDVFIADLKELMLDLSKFSELIEEVLDFDSIEALEFLIKPNFDEGLADMREKMKALESAMSKQLKKAAAELSLEAGKSIKLESNSHLGHFFRLTRKDEKVLRSNKNYETLDTKKDGVRFTSRAMSKLNTEHSELRKQYHSLQADLVTEIMKVAGGYTEPLYRLGDLIALLDVVISLASASSNATIPFVRPKMMPKGSGTTQLCELRHPCLEAMDIDYIPNDCCFDNMENMFHIITGPNMGGKSTYIRSVALAVLMSQIGCFVPCSSATVTVVDSIMARVGAGDNQLKGVSTFMSEMLESSAILKAATPDSLIIIDELGRGTSTYDGFGLAWAISHYIATEIKCFTLFATHFHELTALAEEIPHVNNLHVSALTEGEQLTLLYKVQPGICDESFGLHVAQMVKFPQTVLDFAHRKSLELEDGVVIAKLPDGSDTTGDKAGLKRQRQESHQLLEGYIKKLKMDISGGSSESEIVKRVEELRQEVKSSSNPFISNIISA